MTLSIEPSTVADLLATGAGASAPGTTRDLTGPGDGATSFAAMLAAALGGVPPTPPPVIAASGSGPTVPATAATATAGGTAVGSPSSEIPPRAGDASPDAAPSTGGDEGGAVAVATGGTVSGPVAESALRPDATAAPVATPPTSETATGVATTHRDEPSVDGVPPGDLPVSDAHGTSRPGRRDTPAGATTPAPAPAPADTSGAGTTTTAPSTPTDASAPAPPGPSPTPPTVAAQADPLTRVGDPSSAASPAESPSERSTADARLVTVPQAGHVGTGWHTDAMVPTPGTTASSLATRIRDTVEQLRDAAPPRHVTLDLGDLRLSVSLRGSTVHVVFHGEAPPQTAGWTQEVSTALADRGLQLSTGTGDQPQQRGQQTPDEPSPRTADSRPAPRRSPAGLHL